MIKINYITAKNFLSIGAVTQSVKFDQNLTLILGSNLDLGGDDAGSKNGVGKCLGINTKVKLRNSQTSEIFEITVGELYNAAMEQDTRGKL
jgi:hypothetical protein